MLIVLARRGLLEQPTKEEEEEEEKPSRQDSKKERQQTCSNHGHLRRISCVNVLSDTGELRLVYVRRLNMLRTWNLYHEHSLEASRCFQTLKQHTEITSASQRNRDGRDPIVVRGVRALVSVHGDLLPCVEYLSRVYECHGECH